MRPFVQPPVSRYQDATQNRVRIGRFIAREFGVRKPRRRFHLRQRDFATAIVVVAVSVVLLAVEDLYPYLREDRYKAIVQPEIEKRHKLTSAGRDHPVMHILKDPEAVRAFWDQNDYYTHYYWYAPVLRTKSSATALTVRRDRDGEVYMTANGEPHPLLAIQTYGLGKVFWVGTDAESSALNLARFVYP